jgi:PAS domain-containing protein
MNQPMEALTGYSRDELIGTPFRAILPILHRQNRLSGKLENEKLLTMNLLHSIKTERKTVVSYNATTFYDRENKLQVYLRQHVT